MMKYIYLLRRPPRVDPLGVLGDRLGDRVFRGNILKFPAGLLGVLGLLGLLGIAVNFLFLNSSYVRAPLILRILQYHSISLL